MPQYTFLPANLLAGCKQRALINSKGQLTTAQLMRGKILTPLPLRTTELTFSFRKDVNSPCVTVKPSLVIYSTHSQQTDLLVCLLFG